MAYLLRRRGSAKLPRLRLPCRLMNCGKEIDFSMATRCVLELLVRNMAMKEDITLEPVIDHLQGFEAGDEPDYITHAALIIGVIAKDMEETLVSTAAEMTRCNSAKDYHEALNSFLTKLKSTDSGDKITRQQVLVIFALCSSVTYHCLKTGRNDAFRLFLPWSTEYIADFSRVPSWVEGRGGWHHAFESKTPHCGRGTLGIIASFVVLTTLIIFANRRNGA